MWNARLQNEQGQTLGVDAAIEGSLVPIGGDFRLLCYLDEYGDTYFTRVQIADFLRDWDRLAPSSPAQQHHWALVRDMAVQCQNGGRSYLRSLGD